MEPEHQTGGTAPPAGNSSLDARLARAVAVLDRAEAEAGLRHQRPTESPAATEVGAGSRAAKEMQPALDPVVKPGVESADAESVARAIVLRQLAMTARSRGQLETKLRQRGCEDVVVATVLDRMTEVGLVDDQAYAEMLVRERHGVKGLARRALAHELRRQGVDAEIADEAVAQVGAADERVRAEQLAAQKLRTMGGLAPDVQARRLAGLLARRGYPGEIAWPVIRDAIAGAREHQRD